jgi:transcriptional pleiotropic regulator of transition state genes
MTRGYIIPDKLNTGVIRRLDDIGRIAIPKEMRQKLEIGEEDPMEIAVYGDAIVMKKYAGS